MSIWGVSLTPAKNVNFAWEDGVLDLNHVVLTQGKNALLKCQTDNAPEITLCRVSENLPTASLGILFEQDVTFKIEGAKDAVVSLVGNTRPHSLESSDEEDDCGIDYWAKHFNAVSEDSDEEDSDEEMPNDPRIVDVTEEEEVKLKKNATDQNFEKVAAAAAINKKGCKLSSNAQKELADEKMEEMKNDQKKMGLKKNEKKKNKINSTSVILPTTIAEKAPLGSQLNIKRITDEIEKKAKLTTNSNIEKTESVKPGICREIPGGVKYEILSIGNGKIASVGKHIKVKYEGRLASNGQKFDSGILDFTVGSGDMIKGFDLGVRGMMIKEKRRVFIPSRLAYGKQKIGNIPPNSDLIFDIILNATN